MTPIELSDLERELARGPRLSNGALLGAGVGAIIGWLGGHDVASSAMQGALGGAAVGLMVYGYGMYSADEAKKQMLVSGHFAGALSPYGLHRSSVTYPWSNH